MIFCVIRDTTVEVVSSNLYNDLNILEVYNDIGFKTIISEDRKEKHDLWFQQCCLKRFDDYTQIVTSRNY